MTGTIMTRLQCHDDKDVIQAIESAASAACQELDKQFPGWDNGGVTSNFQGHLSEVITRMLKGQSVLDGVLGHRTHLPRLIIDDTFFGCPLIRGDMFLIHKPEKPVFGEPDRMLVLQPDSTRFRPISDAGDAFTSFEHAAAAAAKYLAAEGLTLEQAKELNLQVLPVEHVQNGTDRGFVIAGHAKAA